MAETSTNPREAIGGNLAKDAPDYAKMEVDRLTQDYGALLTTAETLEADFDKLPEAISSPEEKAATVDFIKKTRDASKRVEGFRELEKVPPMRRAQGIDQFFFGIIDRLTKRDKRNRDGLADIANARLTDYDNRLLAEEQERRRKVAEEAARQERIAREAREKAEREERERLAAAERARKPENVQAHQEAAQAAGEQASVARVEETVATAKAEETYVETLARPADIMRTRTSSGSMSTMAQVNFAEITDRSKLDILKLAPYFALPDLEKALNGYARANGYSNDESVQISGARFGKRAKSQVR
jgi:hypothetical protein